ncbi:hypothetical protein CHS0354_013550 [Potamilus streckersoni]|uniref:Serpin domain-containing protein n=1 Tax=Potamilus streckersoni TaxID=2493646 RepID=A0AAE0WAR8_9BIVA|nr:hypothetical protein CHS0354_013550 [Potamilus streckersoni]
MKSSFLAFGIGEFFFFCLILLLLCWMQDLVQSKMTSVYELSISINEFAFDLYQVTSSSSPYGNNFLSPFSISTVMSMIYLGSQGKTATQMSKTLKIQNVSDTIHQKFEEYIQLISAENANFTLTTANRLYPSREKEIQDRYVMTCFKHYRADVVLADFVNKPTDVETVINSWVEMETKGKIKNLIPPGSLNPLTVLVLVNAIYFKGDWAKKFQPKNTVVNPFYKTGGDPVKVYMMKSQMKGARYGEDEGLDCKVLQLPYKGENLFMLVLLPNKNDGLPALESKLSVTTLEQLQNHMSPRLVEVSLPKFKIEASFELSEALSKLGMPDVFDESKADFSGMRKQKDIYLSKVFHKAFVEVNEEGTEAAAATAGIMMAKSIPVIYSFEADHPFLFLIMDKRSGVILFLGRLVAPTAVEARQSNDEL